MMLNKLRPLYVPLCQYVNLDHCNKLQKLYKQSQTHVSISQTVTNKQEEKKKIIIIAEVGHT